jgi:prepilin signal peptidase PulO-like enzyme (type II secretory pathway)
MIVVFALLGIVVGWLMSMLGDYLISSGTNIRPMQSQIRRPAILHPSLNADLILELICGATYAIILARFGLTTTAMSLALVTAFFALIAIMDYKYRLILNALTYPGIALALLINLFSLNRSPLPILLGLVLAFGVFYLTERAMPGGMGGGDAKLAAVIGAGLGFPQVLLALIVMALATALAVAFMVGVQKRSIKTAIPFAPFMCLGAVVAFIVLTPV